ncbi:hypothetical protein DDJ66_02345 [Klebsiella oxytoca]|nr:hypothetical protein DDJ34_23145 [Klebsiella oxytoca]RFP46963.1 hypothetical protein DDJ69_23200 [Klebsiella oxytoca]RFP57042.1 hypothetical protein DDJ66_02345 [Klebsiella oxytoca]
MLSDSHANARFRFTGYLQYTMYAKLLLKAIPYASYPQLFLPAFKRTRSELTTTRKYIQVVKIITCMKSTLGISVA